MPRGVVFAVVGALALGAGLAFSALAAGAFGLALLGALGWALARTRAPRVEARREVSATLTREGAPVRVDVEVRLRDAGRGNLLVEDALPAALEPTSGMPRAALDGDGGRLTYEATPRIPGRFVLSTLRVTAEDPLGLVMHVTEHAAERSFRALPAVEELRAAGVESGASMLMAGAHLVGQAGPGSDFFALRDFQSGDTMRDVNWRASARTGGRLVVNQREKESQARVTYLVDQRAVSAVGTVGTSARVLQLRALASLAALDARRKDRPRAAAYGAGRPALADLAVGDATLDSLLGHLVDAPPAGTEGLRAAVDALLPALRPKSPVVVLSTLLDDDTAEAAVGALRALEQRVLVVAPRAEALLEMAGAPPARVAAAREQRWRVQAKLRALGARVVDWAPDERLALVLLREVGP